LSDYQCGVKKILGLFSAFVLTLAGASAGQVKVVSFSSILTEIAAAVGGDAVDVVGLVKPGVDPHEYEPTPGDMKQIADAQLVLASGKGMEHYLGKLSSAGDAKVVLVGDKFASLEMEEGGSRVTDPHWWHSVANVEKAVKVVRDALIEVDPAAKAGFDKNAADYLARLAKLDLWVKQKIAELPRDRRELVTSHDAFQYFAKQYGFRIYAIEGISTEQEASAKQVDELIRTIKAEGVKAIFLEDMLNPKVSTEITRDTGAKIGGTLYADGLGTGAAATYDGMMKHNVTTIVEALK
jgi:ABC-type Zn uptake system ZnuABC Zn-binding protein ZnuA